MCVANVHELCCVYPNVLPSQDTGLSPGEFFLKNDKQPPRNDEFSHRGCPLCAFMPTPEWQPRACHVKFMEWFPICAFSVALDPNLMTRQSSPQLCAVFNPWFETMCENGATGLPPSDAMLSETKLRFKPKYKDPVGTSLSND